MLTISDRRHCCLLRFGDANKTLTASEAEEEAAKEATAAAGVTHKHG